MNLYMNFEPMNFDMNSSVSERCGRKVRKNGRKVNLDRMNLDMN